MLSFLLGLFTGIFGDAVRSVLAPSTTEFISRKLGMLFPSLGKRANIQANLQALEALSKAKAAGVAADSIRYLDNEPNVFLTRIGFSSAAFIEVEKSALPLQGLTNAEMTQEASERAERAAAMLHDLVMKLETHSKMSEKRLRDFREAERTWWIFHRNMVMAAGGSFEGGSGEVLVQHFESEALILERIGHLQQWLQELNNE